MTTRRARGSGRGRRWVAPATVVAGVGAVALARRLAAGTPPVTRRRGVSANGMEYEVLGDGPRILLFIPVLVGLQAMTLKSHLGRVA